MSKGVEGDSLVKRLLGNADSFGCSVGSAGSSYGGANAGALCSADRRQSRSVRAPIIDHRPRQLTALADVIPSLAKSLCMLWTSGITFCWPQSSYMLVFLGGQSRKRRRRPILSVNDDEAEHRPGPPARFLDDSKQSEARSSIVYDNGGNDIGTIDLC